MAIAKWWESVVPLDSGVAGWVRAVSAASRRAAAPSFIGPVGTP